MLADLPAPKMLRLDEQPISAAGLFAESEIRRVIVALPPDLWRIS